MKTKALYLTVVFGMMLGFASCDLNYSPNDELTGNTLLSTESGPEAVINGCYAMMKEEYSYVDPYPSGNTYVRHYFQMAEFPADNTCLSGETSDHLFEAACYKCFANMKNISHLWWISYKIVFTANTLIEGLKEGESAELDQLIGEAYFLRAMMHFNLVTLFARPYVMGRDNPGVIIRTSTNTEETKRATVGEVYDQVVADLIKAKSLMTSRDAKKFTACAYGSKVAAQGLLSRVYLYMEENQKVLDEIAEMGDPVSHLDQDFPNYFANALNSQETLFACAHTALESMGSGSIGSMYNGDGGGWGEVYPSAPLMNLYERYPQDVRLEYIVPIVETDTVYSKWLGKPSIFFPYKAANKDFRSNKWETLLEDASGKYCQIDGKRYDVKEKLVNGEYKEYYVTYGGEDCAARLFNYFPARREDNPIMYVTKFSYQGGDPQLSSPVFLRWAEIVLNRAEANAKLGNNAAALADVDAIRARAKIPAEGMFSANMHGYSNVLDIVLDERRMELAFEGHRRFDVYRNRRKMDRRFPGIHPWEEIDYTADKIQYPIPYVETSVSHIPQNLGY